MNKLLKLEWRKSAFFRRATIGLIIISFFVGLIPIYSNLINNAGVFGLLGLVLAIFAIAIIGSVLYLKDDLDQKAPFNMIVPVKTSHIVLSKLSIFVANAFIITIVALLASTLYSILINNLYFKLDNLEFIKYFQNIGIKDIFIFLTNIVVRLLETFLYGSMIFLSMLFVRSKKTNTGIITWLILSFLMFLGLYVINSILTELYPLAFDFENMRFVNLYQLEESGGFRDIAINQAFSSPQISGLGSQIMLNGSLTVILSGQGEKICFLMVLPFLVSILFAYLSVRLSTYLIDRKVDF